MASTPKSSVTSGSISSWPTPTENSRCQPWSHPSQGKQDNILMNLVLENLKMSHIWRHFEKKMYRNKFFRAFKACAFFWHILFFQKSNQLLLCFGFQTTELTLTHGLPLERCYPYLSFGTYSWLWNVATDWFVPQAWSIHLNVMTKKWGMWFI